MFAIFLVEPTVLTDSRFRAKSPLPWMWLSSTQIDDFVLLMR